MDSWDSGAAYDRPATASAYVWDYPGNGMEILSVFWQAAREHDPSAGETDHAGRRGTFDDAADFWEPFLGGTGLAPAYVAGLGAAERERLHEALVRRLGPDPFTPGARAWAVRGVVPG